MKSKHRTENQQKIIDAMEKVYDKLIAFKKSKNTELVVLSGDKIVKIKP